MKDMTEKLSDFGSCMSDMSYSSDSTGDGSGEESGEAEGYMTMNERKRNKIRKRKLRLTPGKEEFLKKPNLTI